MAVAPRSRWHGGCFGVAPNVSSTDRSWVAEGTAIDDSAILESLPTAVALIDADGIIQRANRRAVEILDRADLIGLPISEILGPWPLSRFRDRDGARLDYSYTRRNGGTVLLGLRVTPLPHGAHVLVFQDITPWQRLREERDRLMQLAMVGEALPTILHELKNPLAALNAAVELLIEESAPGPVQDQLHAVLQEARRLRLGFDGVGTVGRNLRSARYHAIDQACRDVFRVLEVPARAAGIAARCDIADLPLLPLEPSVMRAIVSNLVTNAIHACARGDGIVLHGRLAASGLAFELTVSDTGSGMTHEVHARCTELFFTTKRNGSGIGLALVHRAVTEAGGQLEIESVPGIGTTITALIPVLATPHAAAPPHEEKLNVPRR